MRLSIRHNTTYRFWRPTAFNPHRLILRLRPDVDLEVLSHGLDITPRAEVAWSTDVFGNLVATASFLERGTELRIESQLVVEATSPRWPVYPIIPCAQRHPFRYAADEARDLGALLTPDGPDSAVADWAARYSAGSSTDTLSLLKDLNAGVHQTVAYEARAEENTQSAAETLRRQAGACRDMTELFLASVRSLGFGARAASGYLVDPERSGGEDATHAWAEVYVPGAGWIAFDPTHGRMGAAGLVKVAVGRASSQVLPVVGSYVGQASDRLGLEVTVRTAACPVETDARASVSSGAMTC